jgi:predicted DNA binding protein
MPLSRGRGTAKVTSTEDISTTVIAHNGIEDFRIIDSNRYSVVIAAKGGGFLRPMQDIGIIPHTPFEVRDGWVDWVFECPRENIRDLIVQFKNKGIPHRLVSTRSVSSRLLTTRQREVFDVAMREGFYDVKRRITLTEMAGLLGISKSTLSAQLQRIENSIMNTFSDEIRRRSP